MNQINGSAGVFLYTYYILLQFILHYIPILFIYRLCIYIRTCKVKYKFFFIISSLGNERYIKFFLDASKILLSVLLKPNNLIYGILLYESDMNFLISRIICIMQRHILEYTIFFDLTFIANSVIVSLPVNVPANLFAMSD